MSRAKFATADVIGAPVKYLRTGAAGKIVGIERGKFFDSLVIEADRGAAGSIQMVRSVEECAIAYRPKSVKLFDRVTLVDFDSVVTGIVVDRRRNYILVRSEDDNTFWDSAPRFVAKVERPVFAEAAVYA